MKEDREVRKISKIEVYLMSKQAHTRIKMKRRLKHKKAQAIFATLMRLKQLLQVLGKKIWNRMKIQLLNLKQKMKRGEMKCQNLKVRLQRSQKDIISHPH